MRPIDRPSRSIRLQSLPPGIGLTVTSTHLSRLAGGSSAPTTGNGLDCLHRLANFGPNGRFHPRDLPGPRPHALPGAGAKQGLEYLSGRYS